MKPHLCYVLLLMLSIGMATQTANAQDKPPFPTTRKGIVEEFGKKPENPLGKTKSMDPKSVPSSIENDSPRVGALIRFDYDSDVIKPESYPLLREFGLVFQKDLPNVVCLIEGHTDSTGSDEYNLTLSQRRADSVKKYLVSEFRLDGNRLITKPYGKKRHIATNETEDGRALNRRVEFVPVK